MVKTELLLTGQKTIHMAASKTEHDLLGSVIGYIGGKDSRVTGSSLPVYKGKLTVQRDARPLRTPAQQLAVNDYLKKYTEPAAEEKKKKKRKKKTDGVRIIDNDEGLGGIALATAKGAKTLSDEELSDEQGVIVEEQELKRMQEEREKRFSVQVGDGGDGGSSWVTVDEDGNVLKPAGETDRPGAGSKATRDQSPPRRPGAGKRRHDSDDDQSPPRRGAAATDSATGGSGRKRDSDGDQSPPRRSGAGGAGRRDADGDQSPPRRGPPPGRGPTVKSDPDRDQSPPRHSTKAVGRKRHDSDADQSPPRRASPAAARKGHESNGDQSPPRRGGGGPPGGGGKRARHDADGDQSPPRKAAAGAGDRAGGRKRHDSDDDQSPPRRGSGGGGGGGAGPSGRRRHDSDSDGDGRDRKAGGGAPGPVAPGQRTVSGLRAGYVEGKELEDAMRRKKETEDRRFGALTDDVTGRVAATVYRDKSGKRVAQDTEARKAAMSKEEKEEAELKNMVWGKGLVQLEEKAALEAQVEAEKSKPFARTADDAELNDHLKGVQRWGDPMAGKLRPTDKPSRPKYRGPYPPNRGERGRFGIMPGYRWDGVDRSTGFERKWFAAQSARQAKEHAAHMWSVESM